MYHANSVETAITYFRYGTLFSRKRCEDESYPQSSQWSDEKVDKKYGIWNDIFFNFNDFHRLFKKPNKYGHILFTVDVELLLNHVQENGLGLSITKIQPHNWDDSNEPSRWRTSLDGLFPYGATSDKKKYLDGWPDVVISVDSGELPMSIVKRVVIDEHPTNPNFFSQTKSIFENCMRGHELDIGVFKRKFCKDNCKCKEPTYFSRHVKEYKYVTGAWESEYGSVG